MASLISWRILILLPAAFLLPVPKVDSNSVSILDPEETVAQPAARVQREDLVVVKGIDPLEPLTAIALTSPAEGRRQLTDRLAAPRPAFTTAAVSAQPKTSAERPPRSTAVRYQVRAGDTLLAISGRFGISAQDIAHANQLRSANVVRQGQVLLIPPQSAAASVARPPAAVAPKPSPIVLEPKRGTVPSSVRYRVRPGDTLIAIGSRYGVSPSTIAQANGLRSIHRVGQGRVLTIPGVASTASPAAGAAGVERSAWRAQSAAARPQLPARYRVRPGDTLSEISDRFGVPERTIANHNDLASVHRLREGQVLVIPRKDADPSRPSFRTRASTAGTQASQGIRAAAQATVNTIRGVLSWPSRGRLTSGFGWRWRRHHDGIDLASRTGTPIHAARAGTVVFAGWYGGYGRTVILDHGDGLTTLYGHTSSMLVSEGQWVAKGQIIARVGCTGHCTGPHVHFEVRQHGRPLNPLRFLN